MAAAFVAIPMPLMAKPDHVSFPELGDLEHYATVQRGNATEQMLTTRAALDAVKRGEPIPLGTHVVLVDYRDDELYRYFVMEKGEGWGADDIGGRIGNWQFQLLWPDKSINSEENTARCQSCYHSRDEREYLFTYNDIRRFQ